MPSRAGLMGPRPGSEAPTFLLSDRTRTELSDSEVSVNQSVGSARQVQGSATIPVAGRAIILGYPYRLGTAITGLEARPAADPEPAECL